MKKSKILKCSLDANLEVNSRNSMVEKLFSDETEKVENGRINCDSVTRSLYMHGTFREGEREMTGLVRKREKHGDGIEMVGSGFKHTAILQRMMN